MPQERQIDFFHHFFIAFDISYLDGEQNGSSCVLKSTADQIWFDFYLTNIAISEENTWS